LLEDLRRRHVFRAAGLYLVAAWGAVEVSATIFPMLGAPDWASRAVLALVAAGFPVAVALAWRFDLGRDGILRTDDPADRGARVGQVALLAGATVIGLAIPAFVLLGGGGGEPPPPVAVDPARPTAVAVLPFENASPDPDDEYFAHGITDELVGALARFEGIRVLHPSGSARLLATGIAAEDVGRRLDAAYTLGGSVRRSAGVVRITTVLASAETGDVVWQEAYDSDLSVENLFDVQERIAGSVATRFNAVIAPRYAMAAAGPPTRSVEAFDRYLRATYDLGVRSPGAVTRAIAGNPSDPESFHQLGQILMSYGRFSEAASAYHGALALDPTRAMTLVPLAALSHRSRNLVEARRWIDSAVAVGPAVPYAWSYRANIRNAQADHEGALADARRAMEVDPSYAIPARSALAVAERRLGRDSAADTELRAALNALPDPDAPGATDALYLGGAFVALDRPGEALDLLEKTTVGPWLWFSMQHPDFDPVRDSGRFRAVEAQADPRTSRVVGGGG